MGREINDYSDIISLPHHVSAKRPKMSMGDRAAQFSPFEALTGYEETIAEEARLTDKEVQDEQMQIQLEIQMQYIYSHISEQPAVILIRFIPDKLKSGGRYETITDRVKKIDLYNRKLDLISGKTVAMDSVVEITLL